MAVTARRSPRGSAVPRTPLSARDSPLWPFLAGSRSAPGRSRSAPRTSEPELAGPGVPLRSAQDEFAGADRVERRRRCAGRAPDHAGPAIRRVQYVLFRDLVCGLVGKAGGEHENNLMLGLAIPLEDVFQHVKLPKIFQLLTDFLCDLAARRVRGPLADLDMTA